MKSEVAPVHEKKRLIWIDAARGFAIFGIFIVNIGTFSSPYFLYGNPTDVWTSKLNLFVIAFVDIFFQASFYTLFSLLFGFGLGMMKERLIERGRNVSSFLIRRMLILLLFGMVHAFLLWHGDILLSYALIGMLALSFLHRSTRMKIGIAILLLGGSVSLITLLYYIAREHLDFVNHRAIELAFQHYLSSDIHFIWLQNYEDWLYTNHPLNIVFLAFILLPLFLIGMVIQEKRWLHDPEKYKTNLIRLWPVSLILFIVCKMGPYAFGNPLWFSFAQDNIGGMFSALFYIVSITLLAGTRFGRKLILPFTYVGRMALTNYILQSIISFFLFYGIGFGLYGLIDPVVSVGIVVIIYIAQVIWSKWWFTRFRFGPLEWLWRSLTYRKLQPFKKT